MSDIPTTGPDPEPEPTPEPAEEPSHGDTTPEDEVGYEGQR